MKRSTIVEIISSLFILLFVYTAVSKLLEFDSFRVVLSRSPIISNNSTLVAWALPTTELLVAILLMLPRTRQIGLVGSLVLMSVFTLYIAYMLAFTPNLPCSCGGVLKQLSWKQHLVFNAFFTFLSLSGLWLSRQGLKRLKQKQQPEEPPPVVFT